MSPKRRDRGSGNGDVCPLNPEHGYMLVNPQDPSRQWCSAQEHDGRPARHPQGESSASRSFWPTGPDSFRRAVITSTLPEVDISLLGG